MGCQCVLMELSYKSAPINENFLRPLHRPTLFELAHEHLATYGFHNAANDIRPKTFW